MNMSAGRHQRGFSLLEVGIVLIIMAALMGSMLKPFGARMVERQRAQTQAQLQTIRDAVLGFAAARHRLPCPADQDAVVPLADCDQFSGYVPAAALGLSGRFSDEGLLLDSWGNPLRFAISRSDVDADGQADFTTALEMQEIGISALKPDLRVCANNSCDSERANQVVAVIYSTGRQAGRAESADEIENLDGDSRYVSRDLDQAGDDQFDDLVIWLSENVLYSKLIQAGALP
jgi:type II secretory pathway pseudopilin PulG